MDRYCPNCKAKIEDGKKFCGKCGFKIADFHYATSILSKRNIVILIIVLSCVTGILVISGRPYVDNSSNKTSYESTSIDNDEDYASVGSKSQKKNGSLVGRWVAVKHRWMDELEFFSDGTYSSDKAKYFGSYTAENGRLRLDGVLMEDLVFSYELKGDTLIIYDDVNEDGDEYRRVK